MPLLTLVGQFPLAQTSKEFNLLERRITTKDLLTTRDTTIETATLTVPVAGHLDLPL